MSVTLIAIIIFLGLLLIVVEIFVIPGTTIFGFLGALAVAIGIILAYANLGTTEGNLALGISSIASIVLVMLGFRMIRSSKVSVNEAITSKVNVLEEGLVKVGDKGTAFSTIRPNGKAMINDRKVEVYSVGEFIEHSAPVEVVKLTSSRIYVKQINQT